MKEPYSAACRASSAAAVPSAPHASASSALGTRSSIRSGGRVLEKLSWAGCPGSEKVFSRSPSRGRGPNSRGYAQHGTRPDARRQGARRGRRHYAVAGRARAVCDGPNFQIHRCQFEREGTTFAFEELEVGHFERPRALRKPRRVEKTPVCSRVPPMTHCRPRRSSLPRHTTKCTPLPREDGAADPRDNGRPADCCPR